MILVSQLKKVFALFLAAALAVSMTACGNGGGGSTQAGSGTSSGTATTPKKVLRFGEADPKTSLDMQTNTYAATAAIAHNVIEPMVVYDSEFNLTPVLLTKLPTVSSDGLTYSFELKSGVKFGNGETLTSDDVKYTFERMFTPSTGATSTYMYDMIKGAKEMLDGKAATLSGFKKISDTKFEITLTAPYSCFVRNLAIDYAGIFPEKACKSAGSDWGLNTLIGTGPFTMEENKQNIGVTLVKNPNYHGTPANVDEIDIKYCNDSNTMMMEYEKGTIDICALDTTLYKQYAGDSKFKDQIHPYMPLGTVFISLNNKDKVFKNEKVREALSYAIDRKTICENLLGGTATPANGFLNPQIPGYSKDLPQYEYNVAKAKQLLTEAGYPNGVDVTLTSTTKYSWSLKVFTAIQAEAKSAGFNIKVDNVDAATYNSKRKNGQLQAQWGNWYALYPDGDNQMYTYLYSSSAALKSCFYNSSDFNKLVTEARTSLDENKRTELYKQANELATHKDFAVIPLYYEKSYYLSKPYVKNLKINNLIYYFTGVDIDTSLESSK
jgi:peptide/nickel transport system substrate-binding protein